MTQRSQFFPLAGGLDMTSPALTMPPGRVRACKNHEATDTGYGRIDGYERFDGRKGPTKAYNEAVADGLTGPTGYRETARAAITAVPGEGPVNGVIRYEGITYAWRDNVGATQGVMWKSSSSGWVMVSNAFQPGGRYSFIIYNFFASTGDRAIYGVNGVDKAFTFATGIGPTFITTGMVIDVPTHVAAYKKQLALSFPGGSIQTSGVGDPMAWTPILGAAEIGIGDECTGFESTPDALIIFSASSISILTGNDPTDFNLSNLSDEAGALPFSSQRVGTAMYLDNGGFRSVSTTAAYGNFKIGSLVPQIEPLVSGLRAYGLTASMRVKKKSQYRAFGLSGMGISIYMARKNPEPMVFQYPMVVNCTAVSDEANGAERLFAGANDGFVYELDVGTSFDGAPIEAFMMLAFNHIGSPRVLKRWHKAILEMIGAPTTTIGITAEFDYAGGEQPGPAIQQFAVNGGGALWDTESWNSFYWSAPLEGAAECWLDGAGKNIALIIASTDAENPGYTIQGVLFDFTIRGQAR